jgi:hypothetical protein
VKILKQGEPIKLYGCCTGCKTVFESDTKETVKTLNDHTGRCTVCGTSIMFYAKIVSDGVTYPQPEPPPPPGDSMCLELANIIFIRNGCGARFPVRFQVGDWHGAFSPLELNLLKRWLDTLVS